VELYRNKGRRRSKRKKKMGDETADDFRRGDLWQNFVNFERQENARKIRKLSVDRYNLIEESMSERQRPRRKTKVAIHPDWRLFDACTDGNEQELLELIGSGISVNLKGSKNATPLHVAARYDHVRIALYLLRNGANKDAKDMDGWTPLHVATYYDNYGVMSILLDAGTDVFALDCDLNYPINHIMDNSPLVPTIARRMAEHKKFDSERFRLEHNRALNEMVLAMIKRADMAKCFISGLKDFRNPLTGATLAHCLATYGLDLALETVIENDKEVVHLFDKSGFTLLHCAAKFGQLECIKILIRNGASIKAVDNYLRPAAFYAVDKQSQMLLSGAGSLDEFDEADGKKSKNKSKSKKIAKKEVKRVSSRRRFQKSITSRKRPDKVKTMCTKVLISNMTKFDLEAQHAKRRLVQEYVAKTSPQVTITAPQLPPRGLSESTRTSVSSLTTTTITTAKPQSNEESENPYEVIRDSLVSIPKAMSEFDQLDTPPPPILTPKQVAPNPQDDLMDSVDSLNDLPPPPIPPKTASFGEMTTSTPSPKSDRSSKSSNSTRTRSDSSTGDYTIPERSSLLNANVFLDDEVQSTPTKRDEHEQPNSSDTTETNEQTVTSRPSKPTRDPTKRRSYIDSMSSNEPESNEVQNCSKESFKALLSKFDNPNSPVVVSV